MCGYTPNQLSQPWQMTGDGQDERGRDILMRIMINRITFLLFMAGSLFAAEKTFVREYTYQASDYDSKVTSRANALEQVKRILLEEVSVYMQSEFEMRDWEYKKSKTINHFRLNRA